MALLSSCGGGGESKSNNNNTPSPDLGLDDDTEISINVLDRLQTATEQQQAMAKRSLSI